MSNARAGRHRRRALALGLACSAVALLPPAAVALAEPAAPAPGAPAESARLEARGFGDPVDGMRPVTDKQGNLHLRPISEQLAFASCTPIMEALVPDAPAGAWQLETGRDEFPTHASRLVHYRLKAGDDYPAGRVSCFMPGTYEPSARSAGGTATASGRTTVRSRCSVLSHVDFRRWEVAAVSRYDGIVTAALVSPNGFSAGCVLAEEAGMPLVWIPEEPPSADDVVYVQFTDPVGGTPIGLMGYAGEDVLAVLLTAASGERAGTGPVDDGWFALSGRIDGPLLGAGRPEVKALEEGGGLVWRKTFPSTVQPAECMSAEEEGHGC